MKIFLDIPQEFATVEAVVQKMLSINDLVSELDDYYAASRREQQRMTGLGSKYRRSHMSDEWQGLCDFEPDRYAALLHDLLILICKSSGDLDFRLPIPITQEKLDQAARFIDSQGQVSKSRIANIKTALRAMPEDIASQILGPGPHLWLKPAKNLRSKNAPSGTFRLLEEDLAGWRDLACRALEDDFDDDPISPGRAKHLSRMMLCVATHLLKLEKVTDEVRLLDLVNKETFDSWLDTVCHKSPTVIGGTIDAFISVSTEMLADEKEEVAEYFRTQARGLRDPHALPPEAVRELVQMLADPRRVDLLPSALMLMASEDKLPKHTRLMIANVSVGVAAGLAYALRPADIFGLAHEKDFSFLIETRLKRAAPGSLPQFADLRRLAEQRSRVRTALGACASVKIMVNADGASLGTKECDQALLRTQKQLGLPTWPWQRPRDFCAVRMLRADPESLAEVADLLEIDNPTLVQRRYAALLPREAMRSANPNADSRDAQLGKEWR